MKSEKEIQAKIDEFDEEKTDDGIDFRDHESMIAALEWTLNDEKEL